MPVQEQIYRSSGQVPAATPLPGASPEAFGAGIGAAIEGAGNVLEASALRAIRAEKQRQEDAATVKAGAGYPQVLADYNVKVHDLEESSVDGAGHVDMVRDEGKARFDQFLAGIPDPKVRQRYAGLAANAQAQAEVDADTFARGRRIKSIGDDYARGTDEWQRQLLLHPDPKTLEQAIAERLTTIDSLNVPEAGKTKLRDETPGDLEYSYADGLTRSNPAAARLVLESGVLTHLTPEHLTALRNENDSDLRIAAADARRLQSQAEQLLREDVGEYRQRVDRGELPGDDVPAGLITRAKALGLINLGDDLSYTQGKAKISRETDKWTSAEWEQNVNALSAKVAGGKASAEEQVELRVLQELRPAKEARFRGDPEGYAAALGIPAPQVDLANPDPRSVAAKKNWARSLARTGGLIEPPYLNKDQLAIYRDRAAQGPVGQLEVAQELKAAWGMDAAPSIVRQIGGEAKAQMQVMLGLNPRMAQVYRRGGEALDKKAVKLDDKIVGHAWSHYATGIPADVAPAVLDAARKIAAGWMLEQGKTEPTSDFEGVFRQAIHRAGGMLGSAGEGSATGGFANWNGRYAWLPPDMSRTDFQKRIARAAPEDWVRAAVDERGNPIVAVPHHLGPDGKRVPYTKGQALRFGTMRLETVSPGVYHLIGFDGEAVVDAHGRAWQFDVRRLR